MITENQYAQLVGIEHRKKFAQFFTPEIISDFMAEWVLRGMKGSKVLEPAFGLGVFSRSMNRINPSIHVDAYDVDGTIFKIAKENLEEQNHNIDLRNENYMYASWEKKYDGIICNPPYLKFHDYDNKTYISLVNKWLDSQLNGFTNIYTLFLLKSIYQLNKDGRMAYIVPSEFLNSDYGVEVKRYLLKSGCLRHVIIVDFTECAFEGALTTACILLCENSAESREVKFSKIDDVGQLGRALDHYTCYSVQALKPEQKWKRYYEVSASSKYNNLVSFSTFAKVSRGIATGANNYFTFNQSKIETYNIGKENFMPCICHSVDVQSSIFTHEEFDRLVEADKNVFLFNACINDSDPQVKKYIELGETNDINKRYLTANRAPWYAIENRKTSPIWVSVFNRKGLRFIRNKANAYNLTTFHNIYNKGVVDTDVLFAYLITDVAKEIFLDNSRQYGNGLVKFEPNDLNRGLVLDLTKLEDEELMFINDIYRQLKDSETENCEYVDVLDNFFRTKFSEHSCAVD